jgi:hypothetical protein
MAASGRANFAPPATPPRRTASPNKRQRALSDVFGDEEVDDDTTPRPQFAMLPPPRPILPRPVFQLPPPPASPAANSCSSPSKSSGLSSPTKESGGESQRSGPAKNLTPFAHTPVTIKGQNFARPRDGVELPEALADMVDVISRLARGLRVVSQLRRVSSPNLF